MEYNGIQLNSCIPQAAIAIILLLLMKCLGTTDSLHTAHDPCRSAVSIRCRTRGRVSVPILKSYPSERLISDEIERVGQYTIIQVCTDTCSVMKAAWKIIEKKFPWITCTCCAPHVLSLELKDMAKIPEVQAVIDKTGRVLNRFWGKKRWGTRTLTPTSPTTRRTSQSDGAVRERQAVRERVRAQRRARAGARERLFRSREFTVSL